MPLVDLDRRSPACGSSPWEHAVALRPQATKVLVALFTVAAGIGVARRVVADAPPGRYVIPGDGTVLDTKTKLVWQQYVAGGTYSFDDAVKYCATNEGKLPCGPWRLPTPRELATIVDETIYSPAVDPVAFPSTPTGTGMAFWTGARVGNSTYAYAQIPDLGDIYQYPQANSNFVRCVR